MSYTPDQLVKIAVNFEQKAVNLFTNATEKKKKKKLDPKAKVRNRGTVCVPAESAKDKKDHFPINDADQARNALARVHQYSSAPPWYNGSLKSLQDLVSRKVHAKYPGIGKDKSSKKSYLKDFDRLITKFSEDSQHQLWNPSTQQWEAFPTDLGTMMRSTGNGTPVSRSMQNGTWVYSIRDRDQQWKQIPADKLQYYINETVTLPETVVTTTPSAKTQLQYDPKIHQIQIALNKLKLKGEDGKALSEDGKFGRNTRFAINSFKTEYNMPQATDAMAMYYILNPSQNPNAKRYAEGTPTNQNTQQFGGVPIAEEY